MEKEVIVFAFVKLYDNKSHAEEFVKGRLFMNTIQSFREYKDESGKLRGDKYEGIVALFQPGKENELSIDGHIIPASDLVGPILFHGNHLLNQNVFCLYSLNSSDHKTISANTLSDFKQTLLIHKTCFGFGKFCVAVINATEFITRCQIAIKKLKFNCSLGLVDYFDENEFNGYMPEDKLGYQKRIQFSHQREYRIMIDRNCSKPGPYFLNIGDLSDICILTTPQKFNEQLQIKLPNGSHI